MKYPSTTETAIPKLARLCHRPGSTVIWRATNIAARAAQVDGSLSLEMAKVIKLLVVILVKFPYIKLKLSFLRYGRGVTIL